MVRISPTLQQTQAKFHGSRLGSSPWEGSATHPFNRQTATAETLEGCHWGERRKTLQELGEITVKKTVQIYHFFIGLEIKGLHQSKGV